MLTDTQLKLRDAGIQMKLALANARDEDVFRSCINGFLAASRSVTMVMERESAKHRDLLIWYKGETKKLAQNSICRFFKSQREHTIHRGVVKPGRASFVVTNFSKREVEKPGRGLVTEMSLRVEGDELPIRRRDVIHTLAPNQAIYWYFADAPDLLPGLSPNVFRLCEDYFVLLKGLVHEWLALRASLRIDSPGPRNSVAQ